MSCILSLWLCLFNVTQRDHMVKVINKSSTLTLSLVYTPSPSVNTWVKICKYGLYRGFHRIFEGYSRTQVYFLIYYYYYVTMIMISMLSLGIIIHLRASFTLNACRFIQIIISPLDGVFWLSQLGWLSQTHFLKKWLQNLRLVIYMLQTSPNGKGTFPTTFEGS